MSERRTLSVIEVQSPCPADWEAMKGDEKKRFCGHCQKFVHFLGAMPVDEAERLLCETAGSLCVRFARDPKTHAVMTLNYASRKPNSHRRAIATMLAIATAFGSVAAWAGIRFLRKPAPTPIMAVGEVGPAMPSSSTPTTPNQ